MPSSASTHIALEDPFPQVLHEVRTKVSELQRSGGSNNHNNTERRRQQIKQIEQDVNDLRMALDIARSEPERFGLSREQVNERARLIEEMGRTLDTLNMNLGRERPSTTTSVELQNQEMMLREQDEELDDLANAVERIGNMGRDMHEELHNQGQMLDDLGGRFDTTLSRMKAIRQRVDNFMATTGRSHFCTIVWLSIAFLVLTILVVVT